MHHLYHSLIMACTLLGLHCGARHQARHMDHPHNHAHVRGAFWETLGDMHDHVEHVLRDRGPAGLRLDLYLTTQHATLTYDFPDSHLNAQPLQGVEGLCDFLIQDMLSLALYPDTQYYGLTSSAKPLQELQGIRLFSQLHRDTEGATKYFDDFAYQGDLGPPGQDSLCIQVKWDGTDTTAIIRRGQALNHLELAALKLYLLRNRLLSGLQAQWGHRYQFLLPGEMPEGRALDGSRPIVTFAPLELWSNHPNQRTAFTHGIKWKFSRHVEEPQLKR